MPERYYVTPTSGIKIKWSIPTDLKELYRNMKFWMEDNGFAKEESLEKKYVEMVKPNGKDILILWEGGKEVNDYFSYKMSIEMAFIGANEVEVQENNIKRKLTKGSFEIKIVAYLEYGGWEDLGMLNKVYYKLIARSRLEDYAEVLYGKVYKLQKLIKDFAGLSG